MIFAGPVEVAGPGTVGYELRMQVSHCVEEVDDVAASGACTETSPATRVQENIEATGLLPVDGAQPTELTGPAYINQHVS